MVRIEKNKLIIEIKTTTPHDELDAYQRAILRALQLLRLETEDLSGTEPVYFLSELLSHLLLDTLQIKKGLTVNPVEE